MNKPRPEVQILKFTHIFGVSSNPFLLNATISHHLKNYMSTHSELVKRISESIKFYVDDVISGADTEEEAFTMYREFKAILHAGGFYHHKFNTNSFTLQEHINKKRILSRPPHPIQTKHTPRQCWGVPTVWQLENIKHAVGVKWCTETDHFILDVREVGHQASSLTPTKRHNIIVSPVGRIYDPLGFLTPVMIRLKSLFQELPPPAMMGRATHRSTIDEMVIDDD